jgi:hypothetical protein
VGGLAPACHVNSAGACLPHRGARAGRRADSGRTQKKKAARASEAGLSPLTLPEVRVLLWQIVWHEVPAEEFVLHWSVWRRRHQAMARRHHDRQRAQAP